ncbi:MAG: hypothetical protein ACK55I_47065, partial [bacterium]
QSRLPSLAFADRLRHTRADGSRDAPFQRRACAPARRPCRRREDALHLSLAPGAADLLARSAAGNAAVRARMAVDPAPRRGCDQSRERPVLDLRAR